MTKEESNQLAVLNSLMGDVKEDTAKIEKHLADLNGTVAEQAKAISKTELIARAADKKAEESLACSNKLEKIERDRVIKKTKASNIFWKAVCGALFVAVITLIAAWIQKP